jgi:hypothetical protein
VIATLAVTLLVESAVVAVYAIWRRKPLKQLLISCLCANLFTQSILWLVLNAFPNHYLITLVVAEICIWAMEATILYLYCKNQLGLREAMRLSLVMNLASFGLGWVLPV